MSLTNSSLLSFQGQHTVAVGESVAPRRYPTCTHREYIHTVDSTHLDGGEVQTVWGGGGVGEDVGTLVLNMYIGNTISNVMVKIDAEIDPQQRGTTDFFLCVCVYTCSSFYLCNTRVTGRAKRRKKVKP